MHHWFLNELKSCIYSCVKAAHSMSSSRMKPTKCQRYLVENCEWNTISPNGNRINALFCAVSSLISLDVVRMWTKKKKSEWKTNRKEREREKKHTNITSTIRKSECSAIPFAIATNLTGIKCCDKFQYKEKRSKQIKSKSSIAMAQTCYLTIRNRSSLNDRKAYKANAENGNNSCVSMTRNWM